MKNHENDEKTMKNQPGIIKKTMKLLWKTMDLHDEKRVMLPTQGTSWPPRWKKYDFTYVGSQMTSMMKKVWRYLHGITTDLLDV